MDETRLGALLLQDPMMREEDLERCLEIQRLTGCTRSLGQILLDEGVLTKAALDELLARQAERRAAGGRGQVEGTDPERFLRAAFAASANELLLSEGRRVMVRVGGQLQHFTQEPLRRADIERFLEGYVGPDAQDQLRRHQSLSRDFRIEGAVRGRISAFSHFEGLAVVVRLHPERARDPAEAGLTEELLSIASGDRGMVLIAGEVRAGVTETVGALLAQVVREKDRLVLVLDDSLEYAPARGSALVVQRRVGQHTADYRTGLRSAIGQDPDVLVVGDASEPEVFDLCLRAAEAGRLVIAAVRTRSVVAALRRVLGFYSPRDVARVRATLASVLRAVLAIQLLPDADRVGQVMATELLLIDDAAREVIREGRLPQLSLLLRLEAANCGHSMDDSLLALLKAGRAGFEDVFSRAEDKTQILNAARRDQ